MCGIVRSSKTWGRHLPSIFPGHKFGALLPGEHAINIIEATLTWLSFVNSRAHHHPTPLSLCCSFIYKMWGMVISLVVEVNDKLML